MTKKTVITYLKGIPNAKNKEKIDVLKFFAEGVTKYGDLGVASEQRRWSKSHAGVIQGFVHSSSPNSPHLKLRREVIDKQIANRRRRVNSFACLCGECDRTG